MEMCQEYGEKRWLMSSSVTLEQPKQKSSNDKESATETPCRILIVDDSKDAREMTAVLLRELGHVVETARDGSSALAKAVDFRTRCSLRS